MSEQSSDGDSPRENFNPYYVPGSVRSADGDPDGRKLSQKRIEEKIGGVVKTEHGERYRCLVIDRSGFSKIPTSI